jgi:hypothetical protein
VISGESHKQIAYLINPVMTPLPSRLQTSMAFPVRSRKQK